MLNLVLSPSRVYVYTFSVCTTKPDKASPVSWAACCASRISVSLAVPENRACCSTRAFCLFGRA